MLGTERVMSAIGECRRAEIGELARRLPHISHGPAHLRAREHDVSERAGMLRVKQSQSDQLKSEPRHDNVDQAPFRPHCSTCSRPDIDRACAEASADRLSSSRRRLSFGSCPDQSPQCRPVRARLRHHIQGVSAVRLATAFAMAVSLNRARSCPLEAVPRLSQFCALRTQTGT